jgi:para-aminobenzoate synthetase component 1
MKLELPAGDLLGLLRALPAESERPSLLAGRGEGGFRDTLAWNPCALLEGDGAQPAQTAERLEQFIAEQLGRGRLCIGYCSYELGQLLHGVPVRRKPGARLPDFCWAAYDSWLERDAERWLVRAADQRFLEQLRSARERAREREGRTEPRGAERVRFAPTWSPVEYAAAFQRVAEYIRAGDIYQVNLTHLLRARSSLPPRALFPHVARHNPVEHLAYLEGAGHAIHSASPERFVRIRGRAIETFPIKGTRPRGGDAEQDRAQLEQLLASAKEAAELHMITDLLRNDLASVCVPGSVVVRESRAARPGPKVWHTASHIAGELEPALAPFAALLRLLPGGSISGCPKRRALEIIDQLEPAERGVYTGVIGRLDPDGGADSSVAIRTLIQRGSELYLSVGGGIVYDSIQQQEWEETLLKASSFASLPAGPALER